MHTTEIILQINRADDLDLLISLLEKLGIPFKKRTIQSPAGTAQPIELKSARGKNTLGQYIGSIPYLDAEAFEQYLNQLNSEWERDTF